MDEFHDAMRPPCDPPATRGAVRFADDEPVVRSIGSGSPPTLVVQHVAEGFLEGFVAWLDRELGVRVCVAEAGARVEPGTVYVAPANRHLALSAGFTLRVHEGAPVHFHRPSVELLLGSVATHVGRDAVGMILTRMGRDGAAGLLRMRQVGALTLAQEPTTCVVPSMPNAAIELGAVDEIGTTTRLRDRLGAIARDRLLGRD